MKKKLPHISILGVGETLQEQLDSLIPLEPILSWLGYKEDKSWNNHFFIAQLIKPHMVCQFNELQYHSHKGCGRPIIFNATQVKEIIKHVLSA